MKLAEWDFPDDLLFDEHNQWIRRDGDRLVFGLTPYGVELTGDVLYLALPPAGTAVRRGDGCGSLEAGKWVGRIYAPVSGRVLRVNQAATAAPGLIGDDPYGCWLAEIEPDQGEELPGLLTPAMMAAKVAAELEQSRA